MNRLVGVFLLCSPLFLPAIASAVPPVSFGPKTDFATAGYPSFVAIGDVNGDGRRDLVTSNQYDSSVSVLLGDGSGGFGASTEFATGADVYSVAIADLNGDGKLDLATTGVDSNMVSVLLGNGAGGFGAHVDFATGVFPRTVAIADLNGDGKPDLATANQYGDSVSVLLGNGDGTFGAHSDFATGSGPTWVAVGDVNSDGRLDLVTSNYYNNTVSVLVGNGTGSFGPKNDFPTGGGPSGVAIADIDGNNKLDLVTANYGTSTASVLIGNGAGGFGTNTNFATGANPNMLALADLNGDGKLDLATPNVSSNTVSVLLGDGAGGFGTKADFATGSASVSVAIADLNGDGKPDLAVANQFANTVSVLLNTTAGCFGQHAPVPVSGDVVAWWSLDALVSGESLPVPDLVHPSTKKNWGALVSGATLVPGLVGNAVRCEGPTDGVRVPHSATSGLNFDGTESFGADAWIYPRSGAPAGARRIILDKTRGNWCGYTFYLRDGRLGLEVQKPGNPEVHETSALVTEDSWHLAAVAVDRTLSPSQWRFYLDGDQIYSVAVATNVSVAGTTDQYIGRMAEVPADAFRGDIDEVEIWSPPPSLSAIQKLWAAGCTGKRKEYARLPAVSPQCQSGDSARICALLCNMTTSSQTYNWSAGPAASNLAFIPSSGSLTVPAGTCTTIPIAIHATGAPPFKATYHVDVVNVADPANPFTANGSIDVPAGKLCIKNSKCSADLAEPTGFHVHNDSTASVPFNYTLIALDEETGGASHRLRLNGQPPGTSVTGTVLIPPAGSADVAVMASLDAMVKSQPFITESVMLLSDLDADGVLDSLATAPIVFSEDTTSYLTGVPGDQPLSTPARLHATPNPFLALTTVEFALEGTQDVQAGVYDVAGRQIRLLYSGRLGVGVHRLQWDGLDKSGRRCENGIYFIRMERGGLRLQTKVIRLR